MRVFKYLIGLWTVVAVYALFSFLSGPKGLSAYNQLLAERNRQWANMRSLGALNETLDKSRNSLLYDQEAISVYARRLGYGRENERFVRIVGLGGDQNQYTSAGQVYFAADSDFISDKTIKITALCAGLAVFAFLLVLELLGERR
jgi:cell division protein FtsB